MNKQVGNRAHQGRLDFPVGSFLNQDISINPSKLGFVVL